MAYDLVPQYPGSQLVSSENALHANSGGEVRNYQTQDDIDAVLAFMRQRFPYISEGVPLHVVDHSWLSDLAMPIAHDNAYTPGFIGQSHFNFLG
jgi:hypothetical protein